MDITYRAISPADHTRVKAMICEAFGIDRLTTTPHVLASALEVYLRDCLAASSYAQVAVRHGEAVGVLMCRAQGARRLPGAGRNRLISLAHQVKIALTAFGDLPAMFEYFRFHRAYRDVQRATSAPLTNEITLFAVDAACRGMGAGTVLFENAKRYLRAQGLDSFYLMTDTMCSYGFYDRRGLTRAGRRSITSKLGTSGGTVDVLLYAGTP